MNFNSKYTGGIKRAFSLVMMLVMIIGMLSGIINVSAATVHTIPDSNLTAILNAKKMRMTMDNVSYKWNVAEGKVFHSDAGYEFAFPSTGTTGFRKQNSLTLNFTNVMTVNGRQVDAEVIVTDFVVGNQTYTDEDGLWTPGGGEDGYISFLGVYENGIFVGVCRNGQRWMPEDVTLSTSFHYHDSGEKITSVPVYQTLADIDAYYDLSWNGHEYKNVKNEAWQGVEGYTGEIYQFDSCRLITDVDKLTLSAPKDSVTSGNDSYTITGAVVTVDPEADRIVQTFTSTFCATDLMFYSPLDDQNMPKPEKSTDERTYKNGESVTWNVSQKVHTWNADIFDTYTDFSFADKLPDEVEYQSAALYQGDRDVTSSYGTLGYDSETHTVTYDIDKKVLNNKDFYNGETLRLEIITRAVNRTDKVLTAANTATTEINGVRQRTGTAVIQIDYDRVSVSVEKQWDDLNDISGIRPDSIDVVLKGDERKIGDYSVSKEQNWKKTVEDLPKYSEGKEVKYTWVEMSVNGYTSDISTTGNSTIITNTHTPVYTIETEIDHGVITETQSNVPYGSSRTVSWTPEEGRYIDTVTIDGREVSVTDSYNFINISADHEVVVTTLPYHKITTSIDNGMITDEVKEIKNGENRTVNWTPGTGRYVSKVIVNGTEFYSGNGTSGYPTSYEFSGITEDQDIKVETKLIPNLTITKEAGKEVYNVDDEITYTIQAEQTIEGAVATNVVIKDKDKTKGLVFDLNTVKCSDETATITKKDGTFTVSLDELAYGRTITITVRGKVTKDELESGDIKNIATIKSDQTEEIKGDKEIGIRYNVITNAVNGSITESDYDVKYGEVKKISYTPDKGYYLTSVKVDGKDTDIEDFNDSYLFNNVKDNHLIEVVYSHYYEVMAEIDHGTVTPDDKEIKAGENRTVSWTPGEGYYVTQVTVDGAIVYEGSDVRDYPTFYEFTDIKDNHKVVVRTEPVPEETTSAEETTIPEETTTETQEKIGTLISTHKEETTTSKEVIPNMPESEARYNPNDSSYLSPKTGRQAYNIFPLVCMAALIPGIAIMLGQKKRTGKD